MDTTDWELETSFGRARLSLGGGIAGSLARLGLATRFAGHVEGFCGWVGGGFGWMWLLVAEWWEARVEEGTAAMRGSLLYRERDGHSDGAWESDWE